MCYEKTLCQCLVSSAVASILSRSPKLGVPPNGEDSQGGDGLRRSTFDALRVLLDLALAWKAPVQSGVVGSEVEYLVDAKDGPAAMKSVHTSGSSVWDFLAVIHW